MSKTLYVVQYNDTYGNGNDKKLEVIVESKQQFIEWLNEHNDSRDGEPESADEFSLIPLTLFTSENQ